jgi:hypothetical protein
MHHATRAKYIRPVTAGHALASFTGQQMTGQRITGQRITGQRMTGQWMIGPRIKKAPRLSGAMGQDLRAQLIIYIIPVFILI